MSPRQEIGLLSFLYQTRTILQSSAARSHHGLRQRSFFSSTKCRQRQPEEPSRWPSRLVTLDPESQADVLPGFNPNSTLTPLEYQKFRRLFEASARGLPPPSQQKQEESKDDGYVIGESLDEIFDKHDLQPPDGSASADGGTANADGEPQQDTAHGKTQEAENRTAARIRQRGGDAIVFPEALRGAWRDVQRSIGSNARSMKAKSSKSKKHNRPRTKQQKELDEMKASELERVRLLFDKAESDKAIWSLLEKEVFEPMKSAVAAIRRETGNKLAFSRKESHTAEARADKQATRRQMAVTQGTYQAHLVNALRALRKRFPRSPFSGAIMPTVQKLDPISHVLGSGTGLYNELLYMAWRQRSDVAECARLVEDMYAQGLHADAFTSAVFVDAQTEMQASLGGKDTVSPARRMWWHLQGVQSAMTRWHAVMDLHDARAEEEQRSQEDWEKEQLDLDDGTENPSKAAERLDGQHREAF